MMTKVVNRTKEDYDVYIGRPSKWGNKFTHIRSVGKRKGMILVANREEAVRCYRDWIMTQSLLLEDLPELKGKTLGCWCKPKACHGDILAELADGL